MTYTQVFEELCPVYIMYGMTYEQFWHGDPWMVRAYAQGYLLKRKAKNEELWLQGIYMIHALNASVGSMFNKTKIKYVEKPLDIFEKTQAEKNAEVRKERRKAIEALSRFANLFRKSADDKTGS